MARQSNSNLKFFQRNAQLHHKRRLAAENAERGKKIENTVFWVMFLLLMVAFIIAYVINGVDGLMSVAKWATNQ